jgi:putative colanic acid biosynthesis UDP-glucose lipid carrier transferase
MPNFSGGLIRPHSSSLGILHRLMDGAIIVVLLWLCSYLYHVDFHRYQELAAAWAIVFFMLFAEVRGVYQSWRLDSIQREIIRVSGVWIAAVCTLIILAFIMKISEQFSRVVIFLWGILTPIVLIALRIVVRSGLRFLRQVGRNSRTLAFAGAGELSQKMASMIETAPWMGLRVIGVYDDVQQDSTILGGLHLQGTLSQLAEDVRSGKIDYVYLTLPLQEERKALSLLNELADTTASVYVVPDLFINDLLHARWFSIGGIPVISIFESPFYGVDGWVKRLEDIVVASTILLCIFPLLILIGMAVKLTSSGPMIFRQRRYGLNGEIVEVWKFRSMTVCEDSSEIPQAKRADPRITPLGAFLRRTSLDELPQFINVLQGQMSIVGPRPHAVAHNEQYRKLIYGYMLRHKVKPGITGWAQINGWRGETDTLEKMQKRVEHDLYYINNWSIWLDMKIIFRTIGAVVAGKNAY